MGDEPTNVQISARIEAKVVHKQTHLCVTLHFALFNKLRVNPPGSTKMLGALIGLLTFGLLSLGIAVVLL